MIDADKMEEWAITKAGQTGGEFLDELRISDLSRLTMTQYSAFVRCIISSYLGQISIFQNAAKEFPCPFELD